MTTYRKLRPDELAQAASEMRQLEEWEAAKLYAENAYPPGVVKLEVNVESVYNDNTYDDDIESVTAYDAAGLIILPDFSLPFWNDNANRWDMVDPEDNEDQAIGDWLITPSADNENPVYDLTQTPVLNLGNRIFLAEEEPAHAA